MDPCEKRVKATTIEEHDARYQDTSRTIIVHSGQLCGFRFPGVVPIPPTQQQQERILNEVL